MIEGKGGRRRSAWPKEDRSGRSPHLETNFTSAAMKLGTRMRIQVEQGTPVRFRLGGGTMGATWRVETVEKGASEDAEGE